MHAGICAGGRPRGRSLPRSTLALPDERFTRARTAGFLLGFAGVVLVVAPWRLETNAAEAGAGGALAGQLACLLAAVCYGLAFVYTRRFLSGRDRPLPLAAAQLSAATAVMVLLAPLVAAEPFADAPLGVAAAVVLGAVGTGLAYLLYYELIAEAGATSASTVTYLVPVVAVALGAVVLSEAVQWNLFAGAAVVLAGVGLADGRLRLPGGGRGPVAGFSDRHSRPTQRVPRR